MVPLSDQPGHRADELAGGTGRPAGRRQSQGVGRQPHGGRRSRPSGVDVGAGNVPPPNALRTGLPQPNPTRFREPAASPTQAATTALNKSEQDNQARPFHSDPLWSSSAPR